MEITMPLITGTPFKATAGPSSFTIWDAANKDTDITLSGGDLTAINTSNNSAIKKSSISQIYNWNKCCFDCRNN